MALVRGDKYTHAAFKAPTGLCLSALKVPRLSSWCVEAAWVGCVDADFFFWCYDFNKNKNIIHNTPLHGWQTNHGFWSKFYIKNDWGWHTSTQEIVSVTKPEIICSHTQPHPCESLPELQFTTEAEPETLTLTLTMCSQAKVDKLFNWILDVKELKKYFKHVNKVFDENRNRNVFNLIPWVYSSECVFGYV